MTEVTEILSPIDFGDRKALREPLQRVDWELRRLATARLLPDDPSHIMRTAAQLPDAYLHWAVAVI
jgi:hypothetical protein